MISINYFLGISGFFGVTGVMEIDILLQQLMISNKEKAQLGYWKDVDELLNNSNGIKIIKLDMDIVFGKGN